MYIPLLRERVRLASHSEPFVVVRADYHKQTADLQTAGCEAHCLTCIPFSELFAVWEADAVRDDGSFSG